MSVSTRIPIVKPAADPISIREDIFGWVQQQVALLRAGRLDEIDAENLAEEISDLGSEQYDKLESALRVLFAHMLKWDHQPERRSRSWVVTIAEQRSRLTRVLQKNPSLKSSIQEAVTAGYHDARLVAARETKLLTNTFPPECPFSWKDATSRPFRLDGEEA